jgi:hypothetical protein
MKQDLKRENFRMEKLLRLKNFPFNPFIRLISGIIELIEKENFEST